MKNFQIGDKMKTKAVKKKEAEERQAEYNRLTLRDKIERARSRRGKSLKEVSKLINIITLPVDM
jgi:hypothetical protein